MKQAGYRRPGIVILALCLGLAAAPAARAANVQFTAQVDRNQVSMDDSVSLKFTIRADGNVATEMPQFRAPDFEVINEYTGTFVESYYENGKFGVRNNQTVTKVLRPRKTGQLDIGSIQVKVDGRVYSAAPITVRVEAGGAGTPPPKGYGGGGVGLRGAGKRVAGPGFLVRAELDKQKAYKGEQVVVSYYLYRRVRVFNISVTKFPTLPGFLREDLEMPVLGQRLDSEQVVLDGIPYERALLVRYAAYPLKEGKLAFDPLEIKSNYYGANQGGGGADDDPFLNFFQQMAPRVGTSRSDPVTINVTPLPTDGRPATFTGGVGDFTLTAAVDKYEVRANEAITLTVKIEGRGNLAVIEEPKSKWPENVEQYDSKGTTKSGRGGVGDKTFEILLIPRSPGKLTLPGVEFSFFDPAKEAFVTKTTEPFQINVLDPAPGSAAPRPLRAKNPPIPGTNPGAGDAAGSPKADDARYIRPPGEAPNGFQGYPWWRWLYWLSIAGFAFFIGLVAVDSMRRGKASAEASRGAKLLAESKSWQKLRAGAQAARSGASWQDVTHTYELLCGAIYDALDRTYAVGARSRPRAELRQLLVEERELPDQLWQRISKLLEFAETVRFATAAGAVTEEAARTNLEKWVGEGQALEDALSRQSARNTAKGARKRPGSRAPEQG